MSFNESTESSQMKSFMSMMFSCVSESKIRISRKVL